MNRAPTEKKPKIILKKLTVTLRGTSPSENDNPSVTLEVVLSDGETKYLPYNKAAPDSPTIYDIVYLVYRYIKDEGMNKSLLDPSELKIKEESLPKGGRRFIMTFKP
jgi:hypothetical protein